MILLHHILLLINYILSAYFQIATSSVSAEHSPTTSWVTAVAILLSVISLGFSITQWILHRKSRKSRTHTDLVIESWNRALDMLYVDPSSLVRWIAAARIFGYCDNLRNEVRSIEDRNTLEAEIQLLRERVYPLLELSEINYAGLSSGVFDELQQEHFRRGPVVPENAIYTLWHPIRYGAEPNRYLQDSEFTPQELNRLLQPLRNYIATLRNNIR